MSKTWKISESEYWLFTAIDDIYENLENFNPTKKRKLLTVFHDKIAVAEAKTTLDPIVTTALYRIAQQK